MPQLSRLIPWLPFLLALMGLSALRDSAAGEPMPPAPGFPFAGIQVAAGNGVTQRASNAAVFSFGTRALPNPGVVQAVFALQNFTDHPISLDRLQPTCHCTEAEPLPASDGLPTLPPGGSLRIQVTVELVGHAPGPLVKSVWVFVAGQSEPVACLDMAGTLRPPPSK